MSLLRMRQPLLSILRNETDWHRNIRQAPWKLSSIDGNRGLALIELQSLKQLRL